MVVLNDGGAKIDFDYIVINQAGTGEYQNAITKCFGIGEYVFNDIANDTRVPDPNRRIDNAPTRRCIEATANPNTEAFVYDNADVQPRGSVNKGPHRSGP